MAQTGLDETLKLESVYLTGPVPRNLGVLTVLGAVFDKVYFPGVHMPKSGYDPRRSRRKSYVSKDWVTGRTIPSCSSAQ
jgi:hypothetical protein